MDKKTNPIKVDKDEPFYAGQTRILEMVASGARLSDILASIVLLMEAQAEGMLCSILLLDADGRHVQHAAAPSLPEAYVRAVDGAPIGPRNGSCGTAMFLKQPVVVTDVMTDPLWADYRQLAEICGLRSCWSTPILTSHGQVLGSFAMYRQETRGPNAEEQRLAQIATHITGIAIERKRAEEALHHSEEQLSLLQTITMEVATASDLSSALKVVLQRVCEKTGWDFGQSWLPRPGGRLLEMGPVWMGNVAELEKFRAVSTKRNFALGEGLPGRVWRTKHPAWVEDVRSDPNFPRAKIATECGLKAALGIPILARDEVIAVLEFFLRAPRHEDVRLINVIVAVAAQLGMAIERKRAEEAVREREAQISVAAESADVAFWVLYPEQNTAWMSEKGRKIYGFHPHEMLTRDSLVKRAHPDDRAAIESVLDRACHSFEAFESEHRLVLPFGKTRWVIMRGRCFKDEKGDLAEIIGVTIDVSVQKQSSLQMQIQREEIAHLNRVALMGEMTASVAHELNQPLTAIANNASAARRFLERGNIDPVLLKRLLQDMVNDSQRAGEVIRGIRALVRKEKGVRSVLNLNAVIADTLRFVGQDILLRESVITTELHHSLPQVQAVPVQIQQVLINLIMNALDAVEQLPPSERRIVISTRTDQDGLAEVSVRDFGHGLPRDRPDKVFDHFFSTKPAGMGMGLTIVRSIIEIHGGTISAENAPDRGARFFFRLPAASRNQQTQAA